MKLSGNTFTNIMRICLRISESKIIEEVELNKLNDKSNNFQWCFLSKVIKISSTLCHGIVVCVLSFVQFSKDEEGLKFFV